MTQIGTMYARALYSLAAEEGCTEEVLSALSALETSVEQEPEFLRLLSTPNLSKEERCKIIDDSFSGKMPPEACECFQCGAAKLAGYLCR